MQMYYLHPDQPEILQFFTSVFLHGSWMHLIGNMIFLWVFGNAVNDRFGHVGYAAFYLAGGVLSGLGYVLLAGQAPVLGASGAISAVTGCYLVLFGPAGEGYVRLALVENENRLRQAVRQIGKCLGQMTKLE